MVELDVGGSDGGGTGIPTKWLIIGAGALGVGALLLFTRGNATPALDPNAPVYGGALGPNAAVALGSLQTDLRQQSGLLQQQLAQGLDKTNALTQGTLAGVSAQISGQLGQAQQEQTQQFWSLEGISVDQANRLDALFRQQQNGNDAGNGTALAAAIKPAAS